jgi:hypothetical protein
LRPAHLKSAYGHARPFKAALNDFRKQMLHPLAPREAVVLLRCTSIGRVGDRAVLQDEAADRIDRIEAVDRRKDYSNVANLVRTGGMLSSSPAVLCRLFLQLLPNTVAAEPLAILTPKHHLRLGL